MTQFIDTHHAAVALADGVATLTLTNAKSMNILGTPAIVEMTAALDALRARDDVRVLVLRGSGDKAFIGGADIHEMAGLTPPTAEAFITRLKNLCEAVRSFPAPVIARLSGWTLGGGLEVALAADLRLSSSAAHYGMPEVAVGVPSVIHAVLLPRLIGRQRALEMMLFNQPLPAEKAKEWGIVHEVFEDTELRAGAVALAQKLATGPTRALVATRQLLEQSDLATYAEQFQREITVQATIRNSADALEGRASFVEKRPAKFTGR